MKRFKTTAPQLRKATLELSRGYRGYKRRKIREVSLRLLGSTLDSWCRSNPIHQKGAEGLASELGANFAWAATQKLVKAGDSGRRVLDGFTRPVSRGQGCNELDAKPDGLRVAFLALPT
jgi:hypothetical protein